MQNVRERPSRVVVSRSHLYYPGVGGLSRFKVAKLKMALTVTQPDGGLQKEE
jgi:hypothetical protein